MSASDVGWTCWIQAHLGQTSALLFVACAYTLVSGSVKWTYSGTCLWYSSWWLESMVHRLEASLYVSGYSCRGWRALHWLGRYLRAFVRCVPIDWNILLPPCPTSLLSWCFSLNVTPFLSQLNTWYSIPFLYNMFVCLFDYWLTDWLIDWLVFLMKVGTTKHSIWLMTGAQKSLRTEWLSYESQVACPISVSERAWLCRRAFRWVFFNLTCSAYVFRKAPWFISSNVPQCFVSRINTSPEFWLAQKCVWELSREVGKVVSADWITYSACGYV